MRLTLPTSEDLTMLTSHSNDASVSIYLASSPLPDRAEAVQIALKDAIAEAERELMKSGISPDDAASILASVRGLESDDEFWRHQGRAIALFIAPGVQRAFRLANELESHTAVGDRFDLGPLLRSSTFKHGGYVLSLSEGIVQLVELSATDRPFVVALDLPAELDTVFKHADNGGKADPPRADGPTGQRIEQQRFCRLVQGAVLAAIDDPTLPMILAASRDLEPAYRVVNTYSALMEQGIDANPESLSIGELSERARTILDAHYSAELSDWRELFGSRRSNGLATSQLSEAARAATSGAVEELLFDMNSTAEGSIDDSGVVHEADQSGPTSYGIVDEIAVRVLRTGGIVRAVRSGDLPDSTPVAALLRFAM